MKNGAIPILTPPFSHVAQQKTPQQPSIRTPPFLAFALFTPRPLYLCTAPSAPSRLPRFTLSPLRFAPHPSPVFALHAPRLSRPSRFPLAENANRGARLQRKCPRLAENAARGPHSTGNAEPARPYRERLSSAKKKNRRSENRPSRIAPRPAKSEPRNEAP